MNYFSKVLRTRGLATLAVVALGSGDAGAATWLVPTDAATIQAGIDLAAVGDTVQIECGTYYEHGISLTPGVSLRSSSGDPECVTIDAQSLGRVMSSLGPSGSEYSIEGITFTGGHADGAEPNRWGAGLYCVDVRPKIRQCRFVKNSALPVGQGGGVFVRCDQESPTFFDCLFFGNRADYGGGVRCWDESQSQFVRCVIDSNYAQSMGGGIYTNGYSYPHFTDCQITRNHAYLEGGGVWTDYEGIMLTRCLIAGNYTTDASY